jgi:hypothetical protein
MHDFFISKFRIKNQYHVRYMYLTKLYNIMIMEYMQIRNSRMYIVKYAMPLCSIMNAVLRLGIYLCTSRFLRLGYYIRNINYSIVSVSIIAEQI